ncbi:rho GTPase-activating protein 44 isoform X2 [Leptinotarsa decemlineata]|uniref:rho GTPase-activating protein 44 isoform X2 n=1 Tax=Leptinotarsa decemlineata TaxID=7539 RepID=UPI003D30CB73
MKKQFFRVKQLADQTFLNAEKSEILNHEELQIADQKVEYLRGALTAITKKIAPNGPALDVEKIAKKTPEYHLGTTFLDESKQSRECYLFQQVLRECGQVEQQLAREFAEHELKVQELVYDPLQHVLENEFPNILKLKNNLRKYCLDKDSASHRYQSTGKETLKEDMEEADTKVEQNRDQLATEMFHILAKENEISEYILQLLKVQRSYHESAFKSLQDLIPHLEKKIGDSCVRRVFGTSLKEHLRITGKRIAYPLEICITALTEYGMKEEGLFRIAGSTSKVKRLKASIDSGCLSDLIPEYRDVHTLASLLKLYLRELPEPLLTFHLHKDWIEAAQMPENRRLQVVKELIARLPQENQDNLSCLFQFLSKLTKHPENKMTASNIAIVLSPNLLWNKHEDLNTNIGNCVTINVLVELLVKESDVLFPDDTSKLITLEMLRDDEAAGGGFKASTSSLDVSAESPRPNQRKKKSAPVPPMMSRLPSQSVSSSKISSSPVSKPPSAKLPQVSSSTPVSSPTGKVRNPTGTIGRGSDTSKKVTSTKDGVGQTIVKASTVVSNRLDRATMTEAASSTVKPPQQPEQVQTKPFEARYTSSVVYEVTHPSAPPPVIAEKPQIEPHEEPQIRRKDPSTKPEVPARPSSLTVRPTIDVDSALRKTQCSMYNIANKQQPNIITIQSKQEYQLGHDNNIADKEKFLGHRPDPENNLASANSSTEPRSRALSDDLTVSEGRNTVRESIENLNRNTSETENCDITNGNQNTKTSHARTKSDGSVVDLKRGKGGTHYSSRNLTKPPHPPPPPPSVPPSPAR